MTEKQGGSDVRANTTVARAAQRRRARRRVRADRPQVVLLGADVRRLPRPRPDRRRHLLLPDARAGRPTASATASTSSGSRTSSATAPTPPARSSSDGAWARMVGEEGRGVPTIIEMVNHTRLDCVIGAAAGYARRRRPGDPPHRPPLRLRRRADRPAADAERARRPLRRVRGGDGRGDAPGPRLRRGGRGRRGGDRASAASPTRSSSTGSASARPRTPVECLECLGGNGYVEESGMPRLFRESPLNSIWEGSGNVQCLDVLRAMVKSPASVEAFFAEVARGRRRRAAPRRLRHLPARRDPRRHRDDPVPRPPHSRAHGPRPPSLPPGPLRRPGGRRRLLRLPPLAATGAKPSAPSRPARTSSRIIERHRPRSG